MLTTLSSKPATAVANGLAILTPIFAVISWLIPDWFGQLTVAKALLVGLALAFAALLATAILLAVLAWAYRKFRPMADPPATSAAAASRIAELEERLARLGQDHEILCGKFAESEAARETMEEKLQSHEDGFQKAVLLLDVLKSREVGEWLGRQVEIMSKSLPKPPAAVEECPGDEGVSYRRREMALQPLKGAEIEFGQVVNWLQASLVDLSGLREAVDAKIEEIKKDSMYINLLPEDDGLMWRTGKEKRDWYLRTAPLAVQLDWCRKLLEQLRVKGNLLNRIMFP